MAVFLPQPVSAQNWPSRQITIVVGFSAGGSTDIVARLLAEDLRRSLGQPVVVDTKPGAAGNIGAAYVVKAKPDGYTLFMGSVGPLAINASLYKNMPYDNLRDFSPIALVVHVPNMLVVNPAVLPVKSFEEFIASAKANPGKYFFASTGSGTASHLAGELLRMMAGVDAKKYFPGFFLSRSTNSSKESTGITTGFTTSRLGTCTTKVIGEKSFRLS